MNEDSLLKASCRNHIFNDCMDPDTLIFTEALNSSLMLQLIKKHQTFQASCQTIKMSRCFSNTNSIYGIKFAVVFW